MFFKNPHSKKTYLLILLILSLQALTTGCQSKDSVKSDQTNSSTSPKLKSDTIKTTLLQHLPSSSIAFLKLDLENDIIKKSFQKASESKPLNLEPALSTANGNPNAIKAKEFAKAATELMNQMLSSGIFPSQSEDGKNSSGMVTEFVVAAFQEAESTFGISAVFRTNTPGEMVLGALKNVFSKQNIEFETKSPSYLIVKLKDKQEFCQDLHIKSLANVVVTGCKLSEVEASLNPKDTLPKVVSVAEIDYPNINSKPLAMFADLQKLPLKLEQSPIKSLAFQGQPNDNLFESEGILKFDTEKLKNNEDYQKIINEDLGATQKPILPSPDVAVDINLSNRLLDALNFYAKELGGDIEQIKELFRKLQSLRLGVIKGGAASPYPEIFLTAASADLTGAQKSLKELAANLLKGSFGDQDFKQKKIGSSDVDYITTPFGIGLFLGLRNESLVVSTGESAFTTEEGQDHLNGKLLEKIKSLDSALVTIFTDGDKIAQVMRDINSISAPFTGGKGVIDSKVLKEIASQKQGYLSLNVDSGVLIFKSWSVL